MRKVILSLICLYCFTVSYSQHIHYQKTFQAALAQAAKSNKLVLLTISIPAAPHRPEIKLALTNHTIIKLYDKNFINYRIDYTDSAAALLIKKYKTTVYPSYLFIDSLGNPVYKETGGSTSTTKYFLMNDKALAAQVSGRTLGNYIARYKANKYINKNDAAFLKDYITLREELGYDDNADLVDEYADLLSIEDFLDYHTVLFMMEAGPYAYGRTYGLCYSLNRAITDSIYKKEPLALRTLINNRIINNTINSAIANKNVATAQQGARFAEATWQKSNPGKGSVAFASRMLSYYLGVNDTASYLKQAPAFYDNYYMNISTDSAAKVDQEYLKSINATFNHWVDFDDRSLEVTPQTNAVAVHRVSNILNRAAYLFYNLGSHNQTYLADALLWSKRAIELYPDYHNYDTLAHLLYRLDLFEEAIAAQNKAVELALKNKALPKEIKHLKTEQHSIKKHLL